jgi:hypothetical protein
VNGASYLDHGTGKNGGQSFCQIFEDAGHLEAATI